MRYTVAICTYNRGDVLAGAIQSVVGQDYPPSETEILVVDNNSTDDTSRVLNGEARKHPGRLRTMVEAAQGLSHARNRAIAEAKGEVLVFIDDDAVMGTGYLSALDRLVREEANLGAAGGPIEVGWLGPVPEWYEPDLDRFFSSLSVASYRTELRYPRILYGTNMAFPTALLRELGGFHTGLGRKGTELLASEDGEMMLRIERKTHRRILWDPELRVRHLIHPSRLTSDYILRKAAGDGKSLCALERMYPGTGRFLGMLRAAVRLEVAHMLRGSRERLSEKAVRIQTVAYVREWLRLRRW